MILLSSNENVLTLIDAYEGKVMKKLTTNIDIGSNIEAGFTPDSKYVISGSEGRKILFWNLETDNHI